MVKTEFICVLWLQKKPWHRFKWFNLQQTLQKRKWTWLLVGWFLGWAAGQQNIVAIQWFPHLGDFIKSQDSYFFYQNASASDSLLSVPQTCLPHLDLVCLSLHHPPCVRRHCLFLPVSCCVLSNLMPQFLRSKSTVKGSSFLSLSSFQPHSRRSAALSLPSREAWTVDIEKE